MAFENYTELPHIAPRGVWIAARIAVLAFTLALIGWLATGSTTALAIVWTICIPLLPAVWVFAPGVWRNVCPMAFVNQLPRELGFTQGRGRPAPLRTWAFPISILLLVGGIALRPLILNGSAYATAVLLGAALIVAFAGGVIFKGKSGWCGTFCPLAPVQKLYGQLPVAVVRNEYCAPCVGCQTHCYDFNPTAKLASDLYDRDQWGAEQRRFFAGMYPGFVLGYFTYAQFGPLAFVFFPLVSLGAFETVRAFTRTTAYMLVVIWGMTAFALYYALAVPVILATLAHVFGLVAPAGTVPVVDVAVSIVALGVIVASVRHERAWRKARAEDEVVKIGDGGSALRAQIAGAGLPEVLERSSGRRFVVQPQQTLLEAIEVAGMHIETGCRMGMCGADPVLITSGAEHIGVPSREERSTLERLGLAGRCRLACSAHVSGPIGIDIDPKVVSMDGRGEPEAPVEVHDEPSIRVVIVGNGAAGMSTAEHVRRRDPRAAITVISEEAHHFYNRMGIGRLVHGKSGLHGLSLLEEKWYEEQRVDVWLNTTVSALQPREKQIVLATGETLAYDVLVLATGAEALRPPIPGIDRSGSFVLRRAQDAVDLRRWVQTHGAKRAVIIGGGVLGVEAADALLQLGLMPTLIARESRLMERNLDSEAAAILTNFLEGSGIAVRTSRQVAKVLGGERVEGVALDDGSEIACELVLTCAGIVPNAQLARAAGLAVKRGVLVDAAMRTSDPAIFAVGDVAELSGTIGGLWPIGKKQGEIAAATIVGEEARYTETRTMLHVKLAGIDIKSFGDATAWTPDYQHMTGSSQPGQQWRRVLVRDGTIVGGVFVGETEHARNVHKAIAGDLEHASVVAQLQSAGEWLGVERRVGTRRARHEPERAGFPDRRQTDRRSSQRV
jgi:NADPH-dependent 2,4-dienoyl-CoA reductase/sulfur reductase-like enzyme/ferredoxin